MSKHPIHTIQWNYPCNLLGDGSTVFLKTSSEMSILDWSLFSGVMDLHPFILTKFNCRDKMLPKPRNHQFRISNGKCRRCVISTWPKTNQIKKGFMIYPADGFIIKDPSYSKGSDTSWSSDSRDLRVPLGMEKIKTLTLFPWFEELTSQQESRDDWDNSKRQECIKSLISLCHDQISSN